ncbi:MAG: hypothetical protein ACOYJY_06810, partial [Acutalibacteraceae bacterium]
MTQEKDFSGYRVTHLRCPAEVWRYRAHRSPTAAPTIFSLYCPPGAVENVAQDDSPFHCAVIL